MKDIIEEFNDFNENLHQFCKENNAVTVFNSISNFARRLAEELQAERDKNEWNDAVNAIADFMDNHQTDSETIRQQFLSLPPQERSDE